MLNGIHKTYILLGLGKTICFSLHIIYLFKIFYIEVCYVRIIFMISICSYLLSGNNLAYLTAYNSTGLYIAFDL